ncbi:MAG: DUF3135 domain-containing protein [Sedimenticola sp.]|nr:DUF3135 domain-containing protein [Sedimenticola sp.]MCW8946940.1 DUF3135 domain-containing protein [Sedimenticola sp.]MCW8950427.1 DUF3135 domain-containing protein [Sedimenticola sp.]MCW8977148.1 DUF3135 domain-containing protein [Sedimenticola sp.]MDF1528625.1 DUF3135 domain-containing protein [Sedimenticola sp.]
MERIVKKLDFDRWLELANDRPAFEALRQAAIEEVIEQAPESQQERLRRLQWRIDQERHLSDSPMGACIRISRMMWDQMLGYGGLIERLGELDRRLAKPSGRTLRRADIIPFNPGARE